MAYAYRPNETALLLLKDDEFDRAVDYILRGYSASKVAEITGVPLCLTTYLKTNSALDKRASAINAVRSTAPATGRARTVAGMGNDVRR
jgi:hypothetical protein